MIKLSPKVRRPEHQRLVPRQRLLERFLSSEESPVLWVEAVAGAGKTCAVSHYVQSSNAACIWLHVDEHDSDPVSFFRYLALAAKPVAHVKLSPPASGTNRLVKFSRHFFERLFDGLSGTTHIVFDNLEELPEESPVWASLADMALIVPPGVRVFLLSRRAPGASFSRARAMGALRVLDWEDLRLDLEETRSFVLTLSQQSNVDDAFVESAYQATQGWVAGLVLLLSANTNQPHALPQENQQLFDYLGEELYERLDPDARRVLCIAAIAPQVSEKQIVELTGNADAGRRLQEFARRNYLTSELQGRECAFRIHPLFRSFLRVQLQREIGAERARHMQLNVARLLAAEGEHAAAVGLFAEAQDFKALFDYIETHAEQLLDEGRHALVRAWCKLIPESQAGHLASLRYWRGRAILPVEPTLAVSCFRQAYERAVKEDNLRLAFRAWVGAAEGVLFGWGSFEELDEWIEALPPLLARQRPDSLKTHARLCGLMHSALVCRRPGDERVPYWEKRVRRYVTLARFLDPSSFVILSQGLFHHDMWRGNFARAGALLRSIGGVIAGRIEDPVPHLVHYHMQVIYAVMTGDGKAAVEAAEAGLALADQTGAHAWDRVFIGWAGFGAKLQGDLAATRDYLHRLSLLTHPSRHLEVEGYHNLAAQIDLEEGHYASAAHHQEVALEAARSLGLVFVIAIEHIGSADVLHDNGQSEQALEHVEQALRIAEEMGSTLVHSRAELSRARILFALGQEELGARSLATGLRLSREHGYECSLRWSNRLLREWCEKALELGIEVEFVELWIRRWGLTPDTCPASRWPWPLKIYTLRRELVVVRDGKRISFSRKAQRKPLELLEVLIASGGVAVTERFLVDTLWPDANGDAAQQALATTLHRLRKLIGKDTLQRLEMRISLNPTLCWVDCLHLRRRFVAGTTSMEDLSLYETRFLAHREEGWCLPLRETLADAFVRQTLLMVQKLQTQGRYEDAERILRNAILVETSSERLHEALTNCLKAQGHSAAARDAAAFQRKMLGL